MNEIQSRHYPTSKYSGARCGLDDQPWLCDARVEGDRADAEKKRADQQERFKWEANQRADANADLAEAAQDEVRALTLRADLAEAALAGEKGMLNDATIREVDLRRRADAAERERDVLRVDVQRFSEAAGIALNAREARPDDMNLWSSLEPLRHALATASPDTDR